MTKCTGMAYSPQIEFVRKNEQKQKTSTKGGSRDGERLKEWTERKEENEAILMDTVGVE